MMDAILATLIESERERIGAGDCPLHLIDKKSSTFKALIALNIRMTQRYGEYRIEILSDMMDKPLESTKDLTVAEVFALLKFTETMQNANPKQL